MACMVCDGSASRNVSSEEAVFVSCSIVENALENIKNHYAFFKNCYFEKEQKIIDLKQRNNRLMKAVALLQKQQATSISITSESSNASTANDTRDNAFDGNAPKRPRRSSVIDTSSVNMNRTHQDQSYNDETTFIESGPQTPASLLDTGLTSAKLLDISTNSAATQSPLTPTKPLTSENKFTNFSSPLRSNSSEAIPETEGLQTPESKWIGIRRRGLKLGNWNRNKMKSHTLDTNNLKNNENIKPTNEPDYGVKQGGERNSNRESPSNLKFVDVSKNEKHSKSPKYQTNEATKRHLPDAKFSVLSSIADKTSSFVSKKPSAIEIEDKTESSTSKLKKPHNLKQTRLLLEPRCDKSATRTLSIGGVKSKKTPLNDAIPTTSNAARKCNQAAAAAANNSDNDEEMFDFSKSESIFQFDMGNEIDEDFTVRSDAKVTVSIDKDISTFEPQCFAKISDDSVIALSPASQEIIFLDNTENEIDYDKTQIKPPEKSPKIARNDFSKPKEDSKSLELKSRHEIKKEKVTQCFNDTSSTTDNKDSKNQSSSKKVSYSSEDDEDSEFMVRPIIIKEETPDDKVDIKKLYNIDCEDCQNFIDFLGDRLTRKDIEQQLKRCRRHKELQRLNHETPVDFWNPFIYSLPENDPRLEVIIDDRFANKKKDIPK